MATNINSMLAQMRRAGKIQDMKGKGDFGERAALEVINEYCLKRGGRVYHSYTYPYASDRKGNNYLGNIFRQEDGSYTDVTDRKSLTDEIDILYVSPYKIFPIEIKSYHARKLEVYDSWFKYNGKEAEKSPIAQAEKHARHLYHQLYQVLPDGDPTFICPIVCFVDRCQVIDDRLPKNRFYLPVCILNNLKQTLLSHDYGGSFTLDLDAVQERLKKLQTGGLK